MSADDELSPGASWHLIDRCGEAILVAATELARRGPETREIVAALHALADAAHGALELVGAAVGRPNEQLEPLDLELAGQNLARTEDMLLNVRRAYDALDIGPPDR